jgi:hypothetical protein
MKKVAFVTLLLVLAGCGGGHYYMVEEGDVSIYLNKADADLVYFASSLDGYQLHRAEKIDDDTWEVQVPALDEFKYFYIVDGVVYVPPCRMTEKDDFGSENCIYVPEM